MQNSLLFFKLCSNLGSWAAILWHIYIVTDLKEDAQLAPGVDHRYCEKGAHDLWERDMRPRYIPTLVSTYYIVLMISRGMLPETVVVYSKQPPVGGLG